MLRIRFLSMFVLIAIMFSTLSVSAQQPIQTQPTAVQQPSVAGDEKWDDRFGFPLSSSIFDNGYGGMGVTSMIEFQGELYVGGQFTIPSDNSSTISSLARWNGRRWASVGVPIWRWSGRLVQDMIVHNGQLYVTGSFYPDGSSEIARWDGTQWHDVGTPNGDVYDIESYNGELYVAGRFSSFSNNSVSVNSIARWDGAEWHDVGGGVIGNDAQIYTLTVGNNDLYVGGYFTQAGSINAKNIARWNGTTWSALAQSSSVEQASYVYGLTLHNNHLYVSLYNADTAVYQTLHWNSLTWNVMKHGDSEISLVKVVGQDLYLGIPHQAYNSTFVQLNRIVRQE